MEGLNLFIEHIPSVSPDVIIIIKEEIIAHRFHFFLFKKLIVYFLCVANLYQKNNITKKYLKIILSCTFYF